MSIEIKVGSKGELFLPIKIRKELKINPGDRILIELVNTGIFIRKIEDLLDLLQDPPLTTPQSPEDIENEIEKFAKAQELESLEEN